MSRTNYSRPQQPPSTPRRVRSGLKPQREIESIRSDLHVGPLLRAVEAAASSPQIAQDGATYANDGQTVHCNVAPGRIVADIQGTRRRPYQVTIEVPRWTEQEQAQVVDRLLANAAASASIFAGELSAQALAPLGEGGASLFAPGGPEAVRSKCECRHRGVCKHAVAAAIVFADAALERPADLFTFRGLPRDLLVERMRQQRSLRARGVIAAHPDPLLEQGAAPPLDETIDTFWRIPAPLHHDDEPDAIGHISHALLRRLGPSPLPGRFPILGLLASVYDEVSEEVRKMVDDLEFNAEADDAADADSEARPEAGNQPT